MEVPEDWILERASTGAAAPLFAYSTTLFTVTIPAYSGESIKLPPNDDESKAGHSSM